MNEEKERIMKLITSEGPWNDQAQDEDRGVDYAIEYLKQTGRDLATGEYVVQ